MEITQVLQKLKIIEPRRTEALSSETLERLKAGPGTLTKAEKKGLNISPTVSLRPEDKPKQLEEARPLSDVLLPPSTRRGFLKRSTALGSAAIGNNPIVNMLFSGGETAVDAVQAAAEAPFKPTSLINYVLSHTLPQNVYNSFNMTSGFTNSFQIICQQLEERVSSLHGVASGVGDLPSGHVIDKIFETFSNGEDTATIFHNPDTVHHLMTCPYCVSKFVNFAIQQEVLSKELNKILPSSLASVFQTFSRNFNKNSLLGRLDREIASLSRSRELAGKSIDNYRLEKLSGIREELNGRSDTDIVKIIKDEIDGVSKTVGEASSQIAGFIGRNKETLPVALNQVGKRISESGISNFERLKKTLGLDSERCTDKKLDIDIKGLYDQAPELNEWLGTNNSIVPKMETDMKSMFNVFGVKQGKVLFGDATSEVIVVAEESKDGEYLIRFYSSPLYGPIGSFMEMSVNDKGNVLNFQNNFLTLELSKTMDSDFGLFSKKKSFEDIVGELLLVDLKVLEMDEKETTNQFVLNIESESEKKITRLLSLYRDNQFIDAVYRGLGFDEMSEADKAEFEMKIVYDNEKGDLDKIAKRTSESYALTPRRITNINGNSVSVGENEYKVLKENPEDSKAPIYIKTPKLDNGAIVTLHHKETKQGAVISVLSDTSLFRENLSKVLEEMGVPIQDLEVSLVQCGHKKEDSKSLIGASLILRDVGLPRDNIKLVDRMPSLVYDSRALEVLGKRGESINNLAFSNLNGGLVGVPSKTENPLPGV